MFYLHEKTRLVSEEEAIRKYKEQPFLIYTNSENAIEWVNKNLSFSELPHNIELFKDKFKFRELTRKLLPNFFYREIALSDLHKLNYSELPKRFVLKPVVGFFSMGVYIVENEAQLNKAIAGIKNEIESINNLYPKEVLDIDRFIIEEYLEGEEFAFDAFYDKTGEPSVIGIMKHLFASSDDVGDRVYYTSRSIIEEYVPIFEQFLIQLGKLVDLKNYPLHVEVRINKNRELLPIEVNPLRTGGWCTSADLAHHAFGYNPIAYMLQQKKPDWNEILADKDDKRYSIVILTNTTGIAPADLESVDYNGILRRFGNPLELRKSDFNTHPHWGFLFTETSPEHWQEIEDILVDDLKQYASGTSKK